MADTTEKSIVGLSKRKFLEKNRGMIFPSLYPRQVVMWMKDTWIPLDMLFLDEKGTVIDVYYEAQPNDLSYITTDALTSAVVEINGGLLRKLKIGKGSVVKKIKKTLD